MGFSRLKAHTWRVTCQMRLELMRINAINNARMYEHKASSVVGVSNRIVVPRAIERIVGDWTDKTVLRELALNTSFAGLYGLVEAEVCEISKELEDDRTTHEGLDGRGLEKEWRFLRDRAGLTVSRTMLEGSERHLLTKLRNHIVHSFGRVPVEQRGEMKTYFQQCPRYDSSVLCPNGKIKINEVFIEQFVTRVSYTYRLIFRQIILARAYSEPDPSDISFM